MAESIIDEIAGEEEPIPEEDVSPETSEPGDAEEAEPETEPEGKAAPKTVPLPELLNERARRQELQAELRETRDKITRMETVFERFQKEHTPAKGADAIPNYDDDPEGNLRGTIAALEQRLGKFEEAEKGREQKSTAQATEQQLLEQYAGSVRAFSKETPDFSDAYEFLAETRDADLKALGYDDPAERENAIKYEEGLIVGRALHRKQDPAKILYEYAKQRGYKPGDKDDEDKLDRLQKGGDAAKSLAKNKGKTTGEMTLQRLTELADDDPEAFDREWDKWAKTAKAAESGFTR